jgi:hypothetical protein
VNDTDRWDTEPVRVLRRVALEVMREAAAPLRERGWDAQLSVEAVDSSCDHFYEVRLTIPIGHSMPIPIEARPKVSS